MKWNVSRTSYHAMRKGKIALVFKLIKLAPHVFQTL